LTPGCADVCTTRGKPVSPVEGARNVTIDLLKAAVGDLQAAAAKLGRDLGRAENLPPLDIALGLVQLDRIRKDVEQIGKRLAGAAVKK
jgi:hypothetical protein